MNYHHAFIGSHLNYTCAVWGGASSINLSSLVTILKRCGRSILDLDFYTPHKPLFKKSLSAQLELTQ